MGRIKTAMTKRVSNKLLEEKGDKFKDNFEDNKKVVDELLDVESKKIRNVVAGYITRLVKSKKSKK
ncbi:MAG: 30S ribosomal protein S17e [Nanoarchaeota archaeon]|nr:30S ribosomal protein S17e [Nanoarchaeota archaeon]